MGELTLTFEKIAKKEKAQKEAINL